MNACVVEIRGFSWCCQLPSVTSSIFYEKHFLPSLTLDRFSMLFFLAYKKTKNMYTLKKKNLITYSRHCSKCKWDMNRSKWSVTVHDSSILLELQNHPLQAGVSKRSEYLERLQDISPVWTCDRGKKCPFKEPVTGCGYFTWTHNLNGYKLSSG